MCEWLRPGEQTLGERGGEPCPCLQEQCALHRQKEKEVGGLRGECYADTNTAEEDQPVVCLRSKQSQSGKGPGGGQTDLQGLEEWVPNGRKGTFTST